MANLVHAYKAWSAQISKEGMATAHLPSESPADETYRIQVVDVFRMSIYLFMLPLHLTYP